MWKGILKGGKGDHKQISLDSSATHIHFMVARCIIKSFLRRQKRFRRSVFQHCASISAVSDTARAPMMKGVERWTMYVMYWSFSVGVILASLHSSQASLLAPG